MTNIIPCKISSAYADGYNNYQPIPVEGEEKEAILDRIEEYSRAVEAEENTEVNSDVDNADFSL